MNGSRLSVGVIRDLLGFAVTLHPAGETWVMLG
jgi:hypothetical protein